MAGRIRQADVEEVKSRTNIADIIGERVALKSAGVGSMKGLCPFHDERSPSFNVRPQAGFYHCFGCGESGDVYSFLRAMDHVTFTEAVERLAGRIGYTLHYEDGGAAPETNSRARLYKANAAAAEFFAAQLRLPDADAGRRFLGERGFDAAAAAHFGIGFAPKGWDGMLNALVAQGFSRDELAAAGLVSTGQRGVYDRFRGRLVWPIRDVTGQTIGFGARRLFDDDKGPKYLNTPETPIYHKARVLYGLDLAKRDISRQQKVVVVEGYTDVMACHLAGVTTAVATCGTAFGSDHISVLRRVMGDDTAAGEVIFTFDPDAAGQKAALRAFADEKRFAAQTYVAVPPEGLDPCDLRLQRGDGAVRALMDAKSPMFEFAIDQALQRFDLSTVEGRAGALSAAAPIVAEIRDPAIRPGYTRVLARKLGLELGEVRAVVTQAARRAGGASAARGAGAGVAGPAGARGGAAPVAGDGSSGGAHGAGARADAPRGGGAGANPGAGHDGAPGDGQAPPLAVTLATLPRDGDTRLEREALMAYLQYGHAIRDELLARAVEVPFRHPALESVRAAIAPATVHAARHGWAAMAIEGVREPYRGLAAELLAEPFPARDEAGAVASASSIAIRVLTRALDAEKAALRGTSQRLPEGSEQWREVQLRLRDIELERRALTAED
ncbi:MAG: DNA primase [Microbacteriaceae bacterium]